jgi:BirA family biotin operon repressor/biotin-[acetyl-CoA-carboxylase] ligase
MRVLEGLGARGLQLKWPNDVQDRQGRKLAGQLVEGRGGYWILGAGINIRSGPVDNSVGLEGLGLPGVGRGRLAGLLGHEFLKAWHEPGARFPQGLLAAWEERARLGEAVTVYPAKGPSWSGIALGINEQGGLRVQAPEGEVHLKGEECSIRPEGGS